MRVQLNASNTLLCEIGTTVEHDHAAVFLVVQEPQLTVSTTQCVSSTRPPCGKDLRHPCDDFRANHLVSPNSPLVTYSTTMSRFSQPEERLAA